MYLCDRQLYDSLKILHVLQNPLLSSTRCVTRSIEYDEHQTRGRKFNSALVVQNDAGLVTGVKTHSVVMSGSIMYERGAPRGVAASASASEVRAHVIWQASNPGTPVRICPRKTSKTSHALHSCPDTARTTAMYAKMGPRRDSNPGPLTIYRTEFDGITRSKYRTWKQLVWRLNYRNCLNIPTRPQGRLCICGKGPEQYN
jgi:hypothetical protein